MYTYYRILLYLVLSSGVQAIYMVFKIAALIVSGCFKVQSGICNILWHTLEKIAIYYKNIMKAIVLIQLVTETLKSKNIHYKPILCHNSVGKELQISIMHKAIAK